jgi:hypothetical protein
VSAYDEIWRSVVPSGERRALSRETGYSQRGLVQQHVEVFLAIPGALDAETSQERYQMWTEYLTVMIKGGYSHEERDAFFNSMGIDPRDFDWDAWRAAMGYRRRE